MYTNTCTHIQTHVQKFILLFGHRAYIFTKMNHHYRLMSFCYFTQFFNLFYLWLPSHFNTVRGMLFPAIFGFANGPLLGSIWLTRNSLVPHSADKMTVLFLHTSPSLTLWGIRWLVLTVTIHCVYVTCTFETKYSSIVIGISGRTWCGRRWDLHDVVVDWVAAAAQKCDVCIASLPSSVPPPQWTYDLWLHNVTSVRSKVICMFRRRACMETRPMYYLAYVYMLQGSVSRSEVEARIEDECY